jgi:hypothetical protein
MSRLNTSLESSGAEFLVLGRMLIEGIQAFKAYTNFPGYDLIATQPEQNRSCRIQVKSRWATDFDGGFPIKNFDCDFVVFVALNRGYRHHRKETAEDSGRREPQFFVFPVAVIQTAQIPGSSWGKVFLRHIDGLAQYENSWHLIREFLVTHPESSQPPCYHTGDALERPHA